MKESPLGKNVPTPENYDPDLLFRMPRREKREEIGISQDSLPFSGVDVWTAYELSWLDSRGKPSAAVLECRIPSDSPSIVESKSFRLYVNSYSQSKFEHPDEVRDRIGTDVGKAVGAQVPVRIYTVEEFSATGIHEPDGKCLDGLEVDVDRYYLDSDLLKTARGEMEESLYSNLLRSRCPETGQPDWGTIWFHYVGPTIEHKSLLKYIVSFRQHRDFHEHCVERIFVDLMAKCRPDKLTVYGRYTRRGGVDISPYRSNFEELDEHRRVARQ